MRAHRANTKGARSNAVWYAGAAQRACRWRPAMAPLALPSLDGLNWSKIRAVAKERAAAAPADEVVAVSLPLLDALDASHRMLAVYLLGFTAGAQPGNLAVLRERAAPDASWEGPEALGPAVDAS